MSDDLSVDIESMGTTPGSAVAGIGACFFDANTGRIDEGFYVPVHIATCQALGMTIDAATVYWWLAQPDEVRNAIRFGPLAITDALQQLTAYIERHSSVANVRVWMRGPSFDASLLRHACNATCVPQPWKYWNERCHRTITARNANVEEPSREGAHHNALDDAKHQARWLIKIAEHHRARIAS